MKNIKFYRRTNKALQDCLFTLPPSIDGSFNIFTDVVTKPLSGYENCTFTYNEVLSMRNISCQQVATSTRRIFKSGKGFIKALENQLNK